MVGATLKALAAIFGFAKLLMEYLTGKRHREAGRTEAILEMKEASNAALDKALAARRARADLDITDDGLREDDGFRRD